MQNQGVYVVECGRAHRSASLHVALPSCVFRTAFHHELSPTAVWMAGGSESQGKAKHYYSIDVAAVFSSWKARMSECSDFSEQSDFF